MAPRRDKDAQSSFPSLLEPTLEHVTAPFHKSLVLLNCMEKLDYKLGCLRRELQLRCHCPAMLVVLLVTSPAFSIVCT
jgi:hypothetical protein